MNDDKIFIDLQGFRGNHNNFIVKEVAMVTDHDYFSFIVKPPFHISKLTKDKRRQTHWLTKHFHGLRWEDGTVPYNNLKHIFYRNTKDICRIYVKGMVKQEWLENILKRPVLNIEDNCSMNFKSLDEEFPSCFGCENHNHKNCALRKAFLLQKYLNFKLNNNIL